MAVPPIAPIQTGRSLNNGGELKPFANVPGQGAQGRGPITPSNGEGGQQPDPQQPPLPPTHGGDVQQRPESHQPLTSPNNDNNGY
jgi:hypothetical protein